MKMAKLIAGLLLLSSCQVLLCAVHETPRNKSFLENYALEDRYVPVRRRKNSASVGAL
ncbi:hypothetical protein WH47_00501 [Habropoda laboriosa]|uniref:Uncharacterized protein n=1 Tax=Habropoda laboriosa TaxID=597456 RepID=A0A0L7R454_9HYME|nr:hypothetical protein WH47_00501 [Habropoda laboriosa]